MSRSRLRIARELHGLLGRHHSGDRTSGSDVEVATAASEDLCAIAHSDCTILLTRDVPAGRIRTLANHDYPRVIEPWFEAVGSRSATLRTGSRIAMRRRDFPDDRRIVKNVLPSWGFRDGFNLALWTPEGRWVGLLVGSTLGGTQVDDEAVDLLSLLSPGLASLLDPLPRMRPLGAELADGDTEGLMVDRAGRTTTLTAGADVELARRHGPLWPTISRVLDGPDRWTSATVLLGSRVLAVSVEADQHGALVLHRVIPSPCGLSVRELEILDAVSEGATNSTLAARFAITRRTVATYVERLLVKTGCPNRTAAARLAARLNLVIAAVSPGPSGL